jgi:hypothetical protein
LTEHFSDLFLGERASGKRLPPARQPTDCHGQENEAGETIYQFPSNLERPLCHRTTSRRLDEL